LQTGSDLSWPMSSFWGAHSPPREERAPGKNRFLPTARWNPEASIQSSDRGTALSRRGKKPRKSKERGAIHSQSDRLAPPPHVYPVRTGVGKRRLRMATHLRRRFFSPRSSGQLFFFIMCTVHSLPFSSHSSRLCPRGPRGPHHRSARGATTILLPPASLPQFNAAARKRK